MSVLLALAVGVLFGAAVYLILSPHLVRMVIGFGLLSNAVNLAMIASGGFTLRHEAPFVDDSQVVANLMDPLPPDIILTAIVINFAVGALFLIVAYVVYRDFGTANPDKLPPPSDAT